MKKQGALDHSITRLIKLLESQPNLLSFPAGHPDAGVEAAKFCTDFMDTYSDWLMKQDHNTD